MHFHFSLLLLLVLAWIGNTSSNPSSDAPTPPLLWLYSTNGTLRRDAPAGATVQFDGPLRVSTRLPQNGTVSVSVAEPFPLRHLFRIVPSGPLVSGQSFRLTTTRPLNASELPISGETLTLNLMAQFVPDPDAKNDHLPMLHLEEHRVAVQLLGPTQPAQLVAPAETEDGRNFVALRDPEDCALYKVHFRKRQPSSARLIGPEAERFDASISTSSEPNASTPILLRQLNASCADPLPDGPFQLYVAPKGSQSRFMRPLEFQADASMDRNASAPAPASRIRFTRAHFRARYDTRAHVFASPQLVLLTQLQADVAGNAAKLDQIRFGLEDVVRRGRLPLRMEPRAGTLTATDPHSLAVVLRRGPLQLNATLLLDNLVADRAALHIEAVPEEEEAAEEKGVAETHTETAYRFEKPIYAFAVEPAEAESRTSTDGITVGTIALTPPLPGNFSDEPPLYLTVAEGGAGHFGFRNHSSAQLVYRGPVGQFPHDYALKVLLRQRSLVDTALVHVLVGGLGSQPARFDADARFRRTVVPRDATQFELPRARDPDPDARVVYALENTVCRDVQGAQDACPPDAAFVQDSDTNASVIWHARVPERIAEVLLNISARDVAHPREPKDYARILVKFVNNTVSGESNNSSVTSDAARFEADAGFSLRKAVKQKTFPEHIVVSDGLPANTLVASFGLALFQHHRHSSTLNFSLVQVPPKIEKHLAIGRENGLLITTRPLRGFSDNYFFEVEMRYGTQGPERIPFLMQVIEGTQNAGGGSEVSEMFYGFDAADQGHEKVRTGMELGRAMVRNGSGDVELELYPQELAEKGILTIERNGSIRLGPGFFEPGYVADPAVELFVEAKSSGGGPARFLPVHLRLPDPPPTKPQMPLASSPPWPQHPLVLPENAPIGTFLYSLDFPAALTMDRFELRTDPTPVDVTPIMALERRANSIWIRTARDLHGIGPEVLAQLIYRHDEKNETQELGRLTLQLMPAASCQPHFVRQPLRISVDQDALRQLPDETPWLALNASVNAEIDARARNCEPVMYELERAQDLQDLILLDAHNATLTVHVRVGDVDAPDVLPLVVRARSGALQARHALQLHVRRVMSDARAAGLRFVGPAPLLLDIDEGVPTGTRLTTVRAVGDAEIRYRIDAEDGAGEETPLLEIDATSGEIRTLRELDFEALSGNSGHNFVVRTFVVHAETMQDAERSQAQLQLQLRVSDINDNAPTFAHSQYDFVVERNAPVGSWIGRVCARDADASDAGLVRQRLVTTGDLSELAFRLDDDSGDLWLVASVEQVPVGSRFRLELSAEDGDARVSERNAAVNIWICDSSDIVSVQVSRSMVELDWPTTSSYLRSLHTSTQLRPVLHELRYAPGVRGVPGEVAARATVLQVCMLNGTRAVHFEEAERAMRDAPHVEGVEGVEQNLFLSKSGVSDLLTQMQSRHRGAIADADVGASSLLKMTLLFGALLCAVLATLGVLVCQHRRRYMAERRLAQAAMAVRNTMHGFGDEKFNSLPPPSLSAHFLQARCADNWWRRPLPPAPPPLPADSFYSRPQSMDTQQTDYYTVQEVKISL